VNEPWRDIDGRYRSTERIGGSSTSSIYRAVEADGGDEVTIRLLHPHLADEWLVRARFRLAGERLSRVDSPHVPTHRRTDELEDGRLVVVTEPWPKQTLGAAIAQNGGLSVSETVSIAEDILAGLVDLHDEGIVHRNLRPEYVRFDPDGERWVVTGVGSARVEHMVSLSTNSTALGGGAYSAPERFDIEGVDGRADLYSLGVVMVEMLTGRPPRTETGQPAAPLEALEVEGDETGPPEAVREFIERALADDPVERFRSARQMRGALERLEEPPARASERSLCPECDSPVLENRDLCPTCETRPTPLVRRPGEGDYRVVMPRRLDGFFMDQNEDAPEAPDYWPVLVEALEEVDLLDSSSPRGMGPNIIRPFHVIADLPREDAIRVRDWLLDHHCPVELRQTDTPWKRIRSRLRGVNISFGCLGYLGMSSIIALAMLVTLVGISPVRLAATLLVSSTVAALAAYWWGRRRTRPLVETESLVSDTTVGDELQPALEALEEGVTDRSRRLFAGLLTAFDQASDPERDLLERAIEEFRALTNLERRRQTIDVPELVDTVETLDLRIEESDDADEIEALIEDKTDHVQSCERADELDRRIAEIRRRLVEMTRRLEGPVVCESFETGGPG
jgi:serine/threonine protein kinase